MPDEPTPHFSIEHADITSRKSLSVQLPCLAIECSGVSGSVAIASSNKKVVLARLTRSVTTAKSIAPAIQELARMQAIKIGDFQAIYCTDGPGSFTGLRVGLGIARAIAFANQTQLFGVSSLATLAEEFAVLHLSSNTTAKFVTALNAFRDELFVAAWELVHSGEVKRITKDQRVSRKQFSKWSESNLQTDAFTVVGPESTAFFASSKLPPTSMVLSAEPSAVSVLLAAQTEPPHQGITEVLPVYMRGSAAEEKRSAKSSTAGTSTSFPTT